MIKTQYDHKELEDIINSYPLLFNKDGRFSCPIGWIPLIKVFCTSYKQYLLFLEQYHEDSEEIQKISCIKEKFAGLRIYLDPSKQKNEHISTYLEGLVDMTEGLSYKCCQICGGRAKLYVNNNWLITLCDSHVEENCKPYKNLYRDTE